MAAFGLLGCGAEGGPPAPSAPPPPVASAAPAPPTALPEPIALLDVLNRLADPAVPGADKLGLIEDADNSDAGVLDAFTVALRDNKLAPLKFSVTDIVWSHRRPGLVVANVTATPADPASVPFVYPMEFSPLDDGGWQLSRQTADLLLAFGR